MGIFFVSVCGTIRALGRATRRTDEWIASARFARSKEKIWGSEPARERFGRFGFVYPETVGCVCVCMNRCIEALGW
jgi:hypothetical protein